MKRPSRLAIARVPAGLTALAAGAALALGAVPALAAPSLTALVAAVSGISVSAGPSVGDPATMSATAADSNGLMLQSMTVHVYSSALTDVYDATMQLQPGGTPASQTWTATAPISQPGLAAGTYTITADASDGTETDDGLAAGSLVIGGPAITAAASPVTISHGHGDVTISGTVTGVPAGVPVYLHDTSTGSTQPIGTTQADGSYSGPAQMVDDQYDVLVQASLIWSAASIGLGYTWTADPTRVTASVTPVHFSYGGAGQATLSGTAEYQDGSSWLPLTGFSVKVAGGGTSAVVPTDAHGNFTWQYAPGGVRSWHVTVGGAASGVGLAQTGGTIHIAVPTTITGFAAALSSAGVLAAKGCVTESVPGFAPPGASHSMIIQYAASPSGPWLTLGKLSLAAAGSTTCTGAAGSYFTGSLRAKLASAYYRADYPGDADYQHEVSATVHAWKYVTRIMHLSVTPRTVSSGGDITVSGSLQQRAAAWRSLGKQQVLIILKPSGSKKWYWIHKVTTSSTGSFSDRFADPVSATWSVEFDGAATTLACTGPTRYVTVRRAAGPAIVPGMHQLAGQTSLVARLAA